MMQPHQRAALAGGGEQLNFTHPMPHLDQLSEGDANAGFGGQGVIHRSGNSNDVEDALHHAVLVDARGLGLKRQNDAMA